MSNKPKIHGYTTLLSGESMKLPFLETILSWSKLCDKIHVCLSTFPNLNLAVPEGAVVPWEPDKTREVLEEFDKDVLGGKLVIIEHEWDPDNPGEDGVTKQIARASALDALGNDNQAWTAQFDCDEVLREQDVEKLINIITEDNAKEPFYRRPFIITGILELFGGNDKVRFNFGNWIKIRLTRNIKELQHGMPLRLGNAAVRTRNPRTGKIVAKDNRDDGAGFISTLSLTRPNYNNGIMATNPEVVNNIFHLRQLPESHPGWIQVPLMIQSYLDDPDNVWIYHTSWLDIQRKWEMGWFFDNFWAVLSGKQDTFIEKAEKNGEFTRTNSANSEEDLEHELSRPSVRSIMGIETPKYFDEVRQWRQSKGYDLEIPGIEYGIPDTV